MNTPHASTHHCGAALVTVLALMVVILGLAITFLTRANIESQSSASYAASASGRQLADISVNLVQAQIQQATTQDSTVAWASQPGMIRTFSNGNNGPLLQAYKLYSADKLILNSPSASELTNDFAIPTGWVTSPATWTDLNSPVVVNSVTNYPILNPRAAGNVEGFTIIAPPGDGTTAGQMPVQWLYVLQDGLLVAPTGTGNSATVAGSSRANPIIGRVAFWTDDETTKVNINTASEGVFWDTPRVTTREDVVNLAKNQPAQGEFQRYPGHPATTSLSPVLFASSATTTPDLTQAQRDAIYAITPRVSAGGSQGGTAVATGALNNDSDRLFATVDEMIFDVSRNTNTFAAAGLTVDKLDRARFFLTANSRAPEVTLFNTPRVSLWPVDTVVNRRTAFDRLIAFCSTIGGQPYYFQRADPKSATADYIGIPRNQDVYGYLQKLTSQAIPGFGGNFDTKFGVTNRNQLLTQIFDYVRSTNIDDSLWPATPADWAKRYSERGRYAGSPGLNPGYGQVTPIRIGNTQGFGRFSSISEAGIQLICTARTDDPATAAVDESLGSNVAANKTLGGALLTGNQRRIEALVFFETTIPGQGWPPIHPAYIVRVRGMQNFAVNGVNLGFPADEYDLTDIRGGNIYHGRNWGGTLSHRTQLSGARLPARGVMGADAGLGNLNSYRFVAIPITITVPAGANTMAFTGGQLTVDIYAGRNNDIWPTPAFPAANTPVQTYTFDFPSGNFPIPDLVPTGTAVASTTPATDKENWWTFSRDGNGIVPAPPAGANHVGQGGRVAFIERDPGFGTPLTPKPGAAFRSEDVVRTLVPSAQWADTRLIAASPRVPSSAFVTHPSYNDPTKRLAHSITEGGGSSYINGFAPDTSNLALLTSAYNPNAIPDIPIVNANAQAFGDWDNGVSVTVDGPYINKPDEGNSRNIQTGKIPYFDESHAFDEAGNTFFSPNRQIPSAGMLGSLPANLPIVDFMTGNVNQLGVPFRTLLFRPQAGHPGNNPPPDHLLTDLFWMPVVEPYAISEPFSTAGKINMNYQIAPFGNFISRSTGIVALLRAEKILAIPNNAAPNYKSSASIGAVASLPLNSARFSIDAHETLKQFKDVFDAGDLFRSPSQIMSLHLVPQGQTVADMSAFWSGYRLTGDNSRERPYTNLLGRLTTKSNVYTVHYKVQSLKATPASSTAGTWDETRDRVLSEQRGSTTIERYINPNDTSIPDYAKETYPLAPAKNLGKFYKLRVLSNTAFSP